MMTDFSIKKIESHMGHITIFFMKLPHACRAISLRPFPDQYEQPFGVSSTFVHKQSRHGAPHGLTINPSRSHMGHIWVIHGPHMGHTWSTNVPCNVLCNNNTMLHLAICIFLAITLHPISARSCTFMSMHEHIF